MAFQDDLNTIKANLDTIDTQETQLDTVTAGISSRIANLLANQITPDQAAAVTAMATQSTASSAKLTGQVAALNTIATTTT